MIWAQEQSWLLDRLVAELRREIPDFELAYLHLAEGYSLEELAERFGVGLGAVRYRIRRALSLARRRLSLLGEALDLILEGAEQDPLSPDPGSFPA